MRCGTFSLRPEPRRIPECNETVSAGSRDSPGIHDATRYPLQLLHCMKLFSAILLLSAATATAAVTPTNLNRSRYTTSVSITATGTAATLDGAPFPLGTATTVTAVGFHDLQVTDAGVTTSYKFIVRNSERGSTEDGIPTMKPYRMVMDAPGAFADSTLSLLAPAVYPKNLPQISWVGTCQPSSSAPISCSRRQVGWRGLMGIWRTLFRWARRDDQVA